MRSLSWLLIAGLALAGCEKQGESPTTGALTFACAESVAPVFRKEAADFMRLYTKAVITLDSTTTREAVVKLARGETPMAVISRALNAEERRSFAAAKVEVDTFALAKEGVAVIVHPENAVRRLTLEQIRDIYSGKIARWEEVGGRGGKILPLTLSKNTGTAEVFFHEIGSDTTFSRALRLVPTSGEIVDAIAAERLGVGFVGMSRLSDRVRALAVARTASGEYVDIHQASVHQGTYPLVRTIYAIKTGGAYGLANGFIAYLSSAPGQKIFLNAGLVPQTMPVKLIKIEQGT
jgi:phosphate transport system substrate-binding protein